MIELQEICLTTDCVKMISPGEGRKALDVCISILYSANYSRF